MCGFVGEGMPEIVLMSADEQAVDTFTLKSGHGLEVHTIANEI